MKVRFKKHQHPPFFSKMRPYFKKSATLVAPGLAIDVQPTWRIFEKCSHLREKGGVLIFSPGFYGGVYGQNLPYRFKTSYGDFQNCNVEKSRRTTGPPSDLRPDSWSRANSGLAMSSRIFENWIFTSPLYRCRFTAIHGYTTAVVLEYRVPSSWISFLRRFLEDFENSQKTGPETPE
jgi:hypothetical protein